jgi:hypothetical protein
VERPRRVVHFARLMQRRVRVLGGPAAGAASGGHLSLTWLPLGANMCSSRVRESWKEKAMKPGLYISEGALRLILMILRMILVILLVSHYLIG